MKRQTRYLLVFAVVFALILLAVVAILERRRIRIEEAEQYRLAPIMSGINGEPDSLTRTETGSMPPDTGSAPEQPDSGSELEQVPELTFRTGEDHSVQLSEFSGKIIVLNFWASWCPPCTDEMPEFEAFYREHRDNPDVELLSVNLPYGRGSRAEAERFIKESGITFPVYFDETGEAFETFGLSSIPKTVYIGPEGQAGYIIHERTDQQELNYHLTAMYELLGLEPPVSDTAP